MCPTSQDLYPAYMRSVPLIYVLGVTSLQLLWDNSNITTPQASRIFLSLSSIVCLFASMIPMSPAPSFLHFPNCVEGFQRKSSFSPVWMFSFWHYSLSCWYFIYSFFLLSHCICCMRPSLCFYEEELPSTHMSSTSPIYECLGLHALCIASCAPWWWYQCRPTNSLIF